MMHKIKTTTEVIKSKDDEVAFSDLIFVISYPIQGRSKVNQYVLLRTLGEGSFGKVKLAIRCDTGEKYAIKIVKKSILRRRREFTKDSDGSILSTFYQLVLPVLSRIQE